MLGAIAGDIIGSVYEGYAIKTTEFPLFRERSSYTDDSVLTIAVADAILNNAPFAEKLRLYYWMYPRAGYGNFFIKWARSEYPEPYESYGNGSAMRASPVGWAFDTIDQVLQKAKESAECTHNHPEGIKGAQAVASAVFLARKGESKSAIKAFIHRAFGYDLDRKLDDIRPDYYFDVSCQGSVPEAIIAFLESEDFEDAVRKAVSLGGDSDTIACITGSIAEAFYGGVPEPIRSTVLEHINEPWFTEIGESVIEENRLYDVTTSFIDRFIKR